MEKNLLKKILNNHINGITDFVVVKDNYKSYVLTDNEKYVIKIFKDLDKRKDCKKEVNILTRLQTENINVPKCYDYYEHDEYSIIITQFIKGDIMTSLLDKNDKWITVLSKYCELYNNLYMINLDNEKETNTYYKQIQSMLVAIKMHVEKSEDVAIKKMYEKIAKNNYSKMNINGCHLIHGDLHFDNIIINEDDCFIFDWEESSWTEPLIEFSKIAISYDEKLRNVLIKFLNRHCIYDTTYMTELMMLHAIYYICEYRDYFTSENEMDKWTKYRFKNYVNFIQQNL